MARYQFSIGKWYSARLAGIQKRNLENRRDDLALLRIEFELFRDADAATLCSLGEYAAREFVYFPGAETDSGVRRITAALGMGERPSLQSWLQRSNQAASQRPWVQIQFDRPSLEDFRQPFRALRPFDCRGYKVQEARGDFQGEITVGEAARLLDVSENKVRRWLAAQRPDVAGLLMRRTSGRHRRIDAKLLRILWNEPQSQAGESIRGKPAGKSAK